MNRKETKAIHTTSPFDLRAVDRQRRMGLLTEDGRPNKEALTVLAQVFAGQLYDNFYDYHRYPEDAKKALERIFAAAGHADSEQKFLLICTQYDRIRRVLPDPIWWISGSPALAGLFAAGFIDHLKRLSEEERT